MRDFIKWLGVNEKVAKVVVWMFIIMIALIITNTMLESTGFSYYKITIENLSRINLNDLFNNIFSWIIVVLNFYSILLIVFKVENVKKIYKHSIIYLILNILICKLTNDSIVQLFVISYMIIFSFLYSGKNWKYAIYAILSMVLNIIVQYICYLYKIRFIDFTSISDATKIILSLDYFIIMIVIILVKEIYLMEIIKPILLKKFI